MDPLVLSLLIARIVLINTKNLIAACSKAKSDDGKITMDELPGIIADTAIQSLDDLSAGDLKDLMKGGAS